MANPGGCGTTHADLEYSTQASTGTSSRKMTQDNPPTAGSTRLLGAQVAGSRGIIKSSASSTMLPPRKRVRFDTNSEVAYYDGDNAAPMTLEEFIADVPSAAHIENDITWDALAAKVMESYTFVQENTQGLQMVITGIEPFLPADKHHYLQISCAYLLGKCIEFLALPDPMTDYQNNVDALASLYCHLRRNCDECFETARTQAMSQSTTFG